MPERIGLEAIFKTDEFERGLARYVNSMADAVNRTRQAQGGFEAAGATMAGPLSAGAMAAAVAVGQVLARAFEKVMELVAEAGRRLLDFGREAIMTAARTDELNIVLETIGRNAGLSVRDLQALVQRIKALGITTQVAQGLVIQFSRWQLNMAQATDLARLAQDAAVISMQDSSEALDGLMHGIVTMNTRVLRTYGITLPSVTTAQEEYARSLGLTRDQLDETQMIQAVMNAVLEQGIQISGAYEAAMETPGKQLRSLARYTEELAEAMGAPFQGAFGAVVGILTTLVTGLTRAMGAGGALRTVLEGIADVATSILTPALEDLQGLFALLFGPEPIEIEPPEAPLPQPPTPGWRRPRVTPLGHVPEPGEMPMGVQAGELTEELRFIGRTMPEVGALERPMQRLMEALTGLRDSTLGFFEALGLVRPGADTMADAIVGIVRVATDFVKAISGVVDWLKEQLPAAAERAGPIIDRVRGIFQLLADWWSANSPRIMTTVQGLFTRLQGVFEDLRDEVVPFITEVLDKFGAWWDEHGPTVSEAMLKLQEAAANVFGWLAEQLPPIWEVVKPILLGLVDVVLGIVAALAAIVTGDWAGAWSTIKDTAAAVWEGIKEAIGAFADWIAGWFGTTWEGIRGQWEENWEMFRTIVEILWERVQTAVRTKIDEILGAITGTVGRFVEAGRAIIQGLVDGVRAAANRLVAAATGAVGDAIAAARRLLGLGSPSKLFMEFGAQTMMGFAEGLLSGAGMAERAMQTAAAIASRPMAMALAPSGGPSTYVRHNESNLTMNMSANYAQTQSPATVRDDVLAILALARR